MTEPSAAAAVPPSHQPGAGRTIGALLVLLQLANSMTAVQCTGYGQRDGMTAGSGHNMIKGLKLEKLPDMDKVDISNDEFHCKYLEYYRRLYVDESEPNDSDDDVSAIQVQGRVKHHGDSGDNGWTPPPSTGDTDGRVDVRATTITFPIGMAMTAARGGGKPTVVKSVVRIHGVAGRVGVYARLSAGGGTWGKPSLLGEVTWPAAGSGRWRDVDVTRLLQPRKRSGGDVTALEVSLRYPAAAEAIRFDDNGGRRPVLHVFIDGPVADGHGGTAAETTCDRDAADGAGFRAKRSSAPRAGGGVRGGKRRRPASGPRHGFGRTDCKATTSAAPGNGTAANKCCRETMRVVFADIDFDFVVEPKWFDAGLCRGRCPFKYNSATQHAYIQSLLWKRHNKNRNRGTADDADRGQQQQRRGRRKVRHGDGGRAAPPPKPCCAANKLEHLEVLHVDELNPTKLKLSTWEDMVVVECACS